MRGQQYKILFEVNTFENIERNVEGYKFYKDLTIDKVKELVNQLLQQMVEGKIVCFNVAVADQAT